MAKVNTESKKAPAIAVPGWEQMKDGVMRHPDSKWYATPYKTGWFFYSSDYKKGQLGPFVNFLEGIPSWKTQ